MRLLACLFLFDEVFVCLRAHSIERSWACALVFLWIAGCAASLLYLFVALVACAIDRRCLSLFACVRNYLPGRVLACLINCLVA